MVSRSRLRPGLDLLLWMVGCKAHTTDKSHVCPRSRCVRCVVLSLVYVVVALARIHVCLLRSRAGPSHGPRTRDSEFSPKLDERSMGVLLLFEALSSFCFPPGVRVCVQKGVVVGVGGDARRRPLGPGGTTSPLIGHTHPPTIPFEIVPLDLVPRGAESTSWTMYNTDGGTHPCAPRRMSLPIVFMPWVHTRA